VSGVSAVLTDNNLFPYDQAINTIDDSSGANTFLINAGLFPYGQTSNTADPTATNRM